MTSVDLTKLNNLSSMISGLTGTSGLGSIDLSSINLFGTGNSNAALSGIIGSSSSIGNLLSGAYTTVEGFKSNDAQSQIQATMNVVSLISSLLQKFAGGEAAAAASEVAEGQQSISEGAAEVVQFERTGNEEIDACLKQVEEEIKNVQTSLNAIQEKQAEVQAANEKLEAQKQIIAENVAIVNNFNGSNTSTDENGQTFTENDPNVVNSALAAIEGAGAEITTIASGVAQMVGFIQTQEGTLEKSTTNISEQLITAQDTVVETLNNMNDEAAQNAAATVKDVTKMGVEGATNNAVGAAAQTVAASSGLATLVTFGLTSSITAEAEKLSLENFVAGATRIGGVATNMATLGSSLTNATGEMATVASYAKTIGEAATKSAELVGQAGTSLSSLILATGSWTNIPTAVETMTQSVKTYRENMNSNANSEGNTTNTLDIKVEDLFKPAVAADAVAE